MARGGGARRIPERLRAPGPWLWLALALGAALRAYLVIATQGSHDVPIWHSHAGWTREFGLAAYYRRMEVFNHPPFAARLLAELFAAGQQHGIPFRVLLRAPFAALDLATALLLLRAFRGSPARYLIVAGYWLHPLALLFSAYHGNTDSAVAAFALLAVVAAAEGRALAAGAALGAGLWFKLPVALAAPGIFFALAGWRRRLVFAGSAALVGVATALPVLLEEPALLARRVLAYPGARIETPGGVPIWGFWSLLEGLLGWLGAAPPRGAQALHAEHNRWLLIGLVGLFAWLRRREATLRGLGATVCGSFAIFYAFTYHLAFQYLAWAVPFWFFAGGGLAAAAALLLGGYVYGVYALLCGNLLLLGRWDFAGHPHWPAWLVALRDASVLLCLVAAGWFLSAAARSEVSRLRAAAQR